MIITNIEELEAFIKENGDTTVYVSSCVDYELTEGLRALTKGLNATVKERDSYFRSEEIMSQLLNKHITYKVVKENKI